jgi:hypothetical protein
MVERARQRTGCPILHCDVLSDPLPEADWYLASGAMALLTSDETKLFIARCLTHANQGLVFNLLKGRHRSTTFNYQMPDFVEAWADELEVDVKIVDGYLAGDFSAALTHRRRQSPRP